MPTRPEDLIDHRGQRLRHALAKIKKLEMVSPHRGDLKCGRSTATVRMEPGDWIHLTLPVELDSPGDALKLNHQLASNVRFASAGRQAWLAADTMIDGEVHLSRSFQEIRASFSLAADGRGRRRPRDGEDAVVTAEATQAAVHDLGWEKEAVVEREDGWELRLRIDGEVVPVQATIEDGRLILSRTVLAPLPAGVIGSVVADQSLRFNRRLRLARLSIVNDALVAESCLHAQLITPHWISLAARAVATGSSHVEPTLRALLQENVVKLYALLLIS